MFTALSDYLNAIVNYIYKMCSYASEDKVKQFDNLTHFKQIVANRKVLVHDTVVFFFFLFDTLMSNIIYYKASNPTVVTTFPSFQIV